MPQPDEPLPHFAELATLTPAARSTASQVLSPADFALMFNARSRQLGWFLGAGTSAAAGIPTGYDMIVEFKTRLFCHDTGLAVREIDPGDPLWIERIDGHFEHRGIMPARGSPEEYSAYFEAAYPTARDRRNFIDDKLSRAAPSFGHRVLAACVVSGQTQTALTTNFDQLVETSCTTADELVGPAERARLNVADLQRVDVAQRCSTQGDWPLLIKLHGDYQSDSLKNISAELVSQDEELRQVMITLCGRYGLVVAGYSGRDESIMEALSAALDQNSPFPGGVFWVTRPESKLLPAVSAWLDAAANAGVRVHVVGAENFDELMGAVERQLDFPAPLADHVRAARPTARVTLVELPTESGEQYPVLRTSALPVLEIPTKARRIELSQAATTKLLREALRESGRGRQVAIAAIAGGAAAFGRDEDLLVGLSSYGPILSGEVAVDPRADSWAHGLLYDALVNALSRSRPARANPGRHLVILRPPQPGRDDPVAHEERQRLEGLKVAYKSSLHGNATTLGRYFAEAVRVRLEFWLGQWWCVLDPMTWIADPREVGEDAKAPQQTRRPTQEEIDAASSWRRERWAQRYNAQWDALINQWSKFFCPEQNTTISAFGVGPADGVDGSFTLYQKSGWCAPGSRPSANWNPS